MKSSTGTSSGAQNVDELIANISKLMAEAEEMLSETHPRSQDQIRRIQNLGTRLLASYDAAKANLCAAAKNTDTAIRHYPYESVLVALAIGVGLGAVMSRRRH